MSYKTFWYRLEKFGLNDGSQIGKIILIANLEAFLSHYAAIACLFFPACK